MTGTLGSLLLAIFLLAANAFYVAAEFALVKSRGFQINVMAAESRFAARLLQRILANLEAYLACCQLGITMASLGLGWVGEPTVAALLEPVLIPLGMPEKALHFTSFMVGFLVFSSAHIVIGEQVPKTLAIREPIPVSQWIAYPLHVSYLAFYPLNWALNAASRAILRALGVREHRTHDILTDVEIEGLVEESAEHGSIEEGQAEYIQNVFRFGELEVSDVMVHRTNMITINADDKPEEIVNAVIASPVTRLPLWRDNPENIIGILHVKDLLRALHAVDGDAAKIDVTSLMAAPWFVPETRPVSEQLKAFRRRKTPFALVVDEYGEVEGLVTLEDILEEIVGEFTSNLSDDSEEIIEQNDGSFVIEGSAGIREINRTLDWRLPIDGPKTLNGLLLENLEGFPDAHVGVRIGDYFFETLDVQGNIVKRVRAFYDAEHEVA